MLLFYYDVATTKIIRKYRAHIGRVNVVRFNLEESNLIISGSIDGKVRMWDLRSRSFEHIQEIDDCKVRIKISLEIINPIRYFY